MKERKDDKEWTRYAPDSRMTSTAYDMVYRCAAFVTVICFFTGLLLLNTDWVQILIAPKIWLIEYAANLVK